MKFFTNMLVDDGMNYVAAKKLVDSNYTSFLSALDTDGSGYMERNEIFDFSYRILNGQIAIKLRENEKKEEAEEKE